MRIAALVAIAVIIPLCLAADSKQADAPFKNPRAVQAWNRYRFRESKAKETYEREVSAAKTEYVAGLREAAALSAKAGDAGDMKAISEAIEEASSTAQPIRFIPVKLNWHDADRIAKLFGARLAIIKSEKQLQAAIAATNGASAWLGATRSNGQWQWSDGTPISGGYWMPNGSTSGDYLHIHGGAAAEGRWNGTTADNRHMDGFLVEME